MPDGKSLLFTSDRGGSPQVYRLTLGSDAVERLTFDGNYNVSPRPFPDGKGFAFVRRDGGRFQVATQDFASRQVQVLTSGPLDESPSVAPNGRLILYANEVGGRGTLAAVSSDGRVKQRLARRPPTCANPPGVRSRGPDPHVARIPVPRHSSRSQPRSRRLHEKIPRCRHYGGLFCCTCRLFHAAVGAGRRPVRRSCGRGRQGGNLDQRHHDLRHLGVLGPARAPIRSRIPTTSCPSAACTSSSTASWSRTSTRR